MIRPLEPRTERLLALLCGFVSGLLIGGVSAAPVGVMAVAAPSVRVAPDDPMAETAEDAGPRQQETASQVLS
jgi:hypothetical protein